MDVLTILIVLALVATIVTLFLGLIAMGSAGSTDKEVGEPLMWARVGLQGLAIVLLLVAIWVR